MRAIVYILIILMLPSKIIGQNYVDENGWKQGEWRVNNYKGDISRIDHFKNDTLNGSFVVYYQPGKIYQEGTYRMGRLDGPFREYSSEGNIFKEFVFIDGVLDGTAKHYAKGRLTMEANFQNGKINGHFTTFFKNGNAFTISYYRNGCLLGMDVFNKKGVRKSLFFPNTDKNAFASRVIYKNNGKSRHKDVKNPTPIETYLYDREYFICDLKEASSAEH